MDLTEGLARLAATKQERFGFSISAEAQLETFRVGSVRPTLVSRNISYEELNNQLARLQRYERRAFSRRWRALRGAFINMTWPSTSSICENRLILSASTGSPPRQSVLFRQPSEKDAGKNNGNARAAMKVRPTGLILPMTTPFARDDGIDFKLVAPQVDWLIGAGSHGIAAAASSGRWVPCASKLRNENHN
jgi:hypothetical protein